MKVAWKLALSYFVHHPLRMLLTSLAMIASACMVVWVVSSYDTLASQFGQQAKVYLGRYDFFVVPEDPKDPSLDADLVAALRNDPAVAEVEPAIQITARVMNPDAVPDMGGGSGGPGGRPGGPGRGGFGGMGGPGGQRGGPQGARQPGRPRGAPGRPGMPGFFGGGSPMLVGTDALAPPHPMVQGNWIDPKHPEIHNPDRRGAVIDSASAERLKLKVGDYALVIVGPKEFRVKIVGLIEEGPSQMGMGRRMRPPGSEAPRTGIEAGPASSAVYVPLELAKFFSRDKAKINLINVRLKPEAKSQIADFLKTWDAHIAQSRPAASLLGVADIKSGMEEGMMGSNVRKEAWKASGLALLAALFIIFTTLSMGATERVRQFAVMRAVGLTRFQVAQVIVIEGLLLALIGWGGGMLAGWGMLVVAARIKTGVFQTDIALGTWSILLTGLSALGGALAASILPAWQVIRVQPLEAMSPHRTARPVMVWTGALALVGLALIAINPILVYIAPASQTLDSDRLYYLYMALGCSTMAVGFLLLTPAVILIVEAVLGPVVARLLGLQPQLLRSQLGSNLWRTLGTSAALTVGLGLFVSMQIWGYSMLEPFKPGDWNPDMLVSFQRGGLPDAEIAAVRAIPGVRADRCIPLAVEQPKLASDITGSEKRQSVISQNNVIIIGLDPEVAFGGDDPLLKVKFVEGDPAEVVAKLKAGRNCIVPDHFLKAAKLKLGDRFSMVPPESPQKRAEYTIVGAVKLPGWHWMTKFSGLRRREGRSAAMIFANYNAVRDDFNLQQVNFFWLNVDREYGAKNMDKALAIVERMKAEVEIGKIADQLALASGGFADVKLQNELAAVGDRLRGLVNRPASGPGPAPVVDEEVDAKRAAVLLVGEALQPVADRNPGEQQPVNMQGTWAGPATTFGSSVRITTPEVIRSRITDRASGMIWTLCYLPLITLLITSLGVVNTVMASVRARRWEFGVLRAQGVTRSGLVRMILAEGLMIGLITCLLSLGFGVFSGWCETGISQYISFFGGLNPPLVIPWAPLGFGFGLTLALCLAAALYPAVATGRAEPLRLLQEGRAAL